MAAVDGAAAYVAKFCRREALGVAVQHRLVLILEELVTNTVSYGHPPPASQIRVVLDREADHVLLLYRDEGTAFNPLEERPAADLSATTDRASEGGVGWPIIVHYSESIDYRREGAENVLHFVIPIAEDTAPSALD